MQAAGASCGKTHATWSELFWFHHGLVTEKCHVIFSQSQSATIRYQNTVKPFTVNLFSRVRLVTSISGAYFPFVNGLDHFLRTMPPLFTNDDGDENGIKSIGLDWQNNNFARASCIFGTFLCRLCTPT